jgi:hypothetical protein
LVVDCISRPSKRLRWQLGVVSENPNAPTHFVGYARKQNLAAMISRFQTHLWFGILAGWLNRHQQTMVDYLRTENEVLKRQLIGLQPILTDDKRRRLALRGKALGRKALESVACIATPIPSWPNTAG